MSQRYLGGIITANPTTPTLSSASGVWTLEQQLQYSQSIQPKVIPKSVRLRASASAYMARTPTSVTSGRAWTWSAWVKRGVLGNSGLFDGYVSTTNFTTLTFSSNSLLFYSYVSAVEKANMVTPAVFRDPSAWYHIVLAYDSANATSADRLIIYVNGVRQTLTTTTAVTQNDVTYINNTSASQRLGIRSDVPYYFDGEIAETNFVDGQVLTPSSFGAYDSNGVWQPLGYTGTYGSNGVYLPFNVNTTSTYGGSFNGSNQYIGITANAAFAFTTGAFTAECWFNSTSIAAYQEFVDFWPSASGSYTVGQWQFGTDNAGHLQWTVATSSTSAGNVSLTSTATYLANTWNHAAVVRNGSTVTLYLNGVSVASTTFSGTVGASTVAGSLGRQTTGSSYLNGYLSNVRVTNTAVYTAAFTPPTSALTAVSGTQLLTLQNATLVDNSPNAFSLTNGNTVTFGVQYPFTANIAADSSGNGNNWSPFNISLVNGTTYDSMLDSPTNFNDGTSYGVGNYAVLNGASNSSASNSFTFSNANLQASASVSSGGRGITSTVEMRAGKWYAEFVVSSWGASNNADIGILRSDTALYTTGSFALSGCIGSYLSNGYSINQIGGVYNNGTSLASGLTSYTTSDIVQVAYDADNGKLYFGKNNTWLNSSDPSAGTNGFSVTTGYGYLFAFGGSSNTAQTVTVVANFGQRPFTYTPPTNFKASNTQNAILAAPPTITNGAKYMAATLYTGTGASQSISNGTNNTIGTTFQPDFVWNKSRSNAYAHSLYDSVRGVNKYIQSSNTNAEATLANSLNSFNSGGFTMGGQDNLNGATYVAWQWQAGAGTTSSNTNGSITSTVSVGSTQGFSVVTYTGTGANGTVGHGLGVAPSMIIVKSRSIIENWPVYHASMNASPASGRLILDGTADFTASATTWNSTAPTSTVFSIGTATAVNTSSATYVAYCFSAVRGYSAFGSYTGNGSADGPFVYLGFRPRFILIKHYSGSISSITNAYWVMMDTSRDTYNIMPDILTAQSSSAESSYAGSGVLDALSNGFKIRFASADICNYSGGNYLYAAFAENPFTIARAR